MTKTTKKKQYNIKLTGVYTKRKNCYIGWCEQIPGVNVQANTLKEAKEHMREVIDLILKSYEKVSKKHYYRLKKTTREVVLRAKI